MDLFLHLGLQIVRSRVRFGGLLGERYMELQLQFGYGMMEHSRTLLRRWGGGTVILSPRDLTDDQLERYSASVSDITETRLLLDPQFYLPNADHERLCSHEYWPEQYQTGTFWQGPALRQLLQSLRNLNNRLGTSAFVLPGMLATRVDEDWMAIQQSTAEEARTLDMGKPLMMTIALSSEASRDPDQIANLLERAEHWTADSFYVVIEHPNGQYFVEDPNWLANTIDLAAGLRLMKKSVVLGYCNHQMLIAALAKTTAIASGTWMNVRSFPPEKFVVDYEEEMKQRATWYYCPQALSEYKIPFLDIASRLGLLGRMVPPADLDGGFAAALFGGAQPSSVGFTEQAAFRHYLHALHEQVSRTTRATFDETVDDHRRTLDGAESQLRILTASGIRGQQRDFSATVDVNRAALELFVALRGPILRREWSNF
jgi:hypothetical protein